MQCIYTAYILACFKMHSRLTNTRLSRAGAPWACWATSRPTGQTHIASVGAGHPWSAAANAHTTPKLPAPGLGCQTATRRRSSTPSSSWENGWSRSVKSHCPSTQGSRHYFQLLSYAHFLLLRLAFATTGGLPEEGPDHVCCWHWMRRARLRLWSPLRAPPRARPPAAASAAQLQLQPSSCSPAQPTCSSV